MGLRQWIRNGERYRILSHDPPLIGGVTGTEYPNSVQKKNPRMGLVFWYFFAYADSYDAAIRHIAQDQSRRLKPLPFQRKTSVIKEISGQDYAAQTSDHSRAPTD